MMSTAALARRSAHHVENCRERGACACLRARTVRMQGARDRRPLTRSHQPALTQPAFIVPGALKTHVVAAPPRRVARRRALVTRVPERPPGEVEEQCIARLHIPAQDLVLFSHVRDRRQFCGAVIRVSVRWSCPRSSSAVHQLRAVAAADVAEPALRRHVVERDPDRRSCRRAGASGGVVVPRRRRDRVRATNESVLVTNAP